MNYNEDSEIQMDFFQEHRNPDEPYLSQQEVVYLVWLLTGYPAHGPISPSCFHAWKDLVGEQEPGQKRELYSNYLVGKLVLYSRMCSQYRQKEQANLRFWDEFDQYKSHEELIHAQVSTRIQKIATGEIQPPRVRKRRRSRERWNNRTISVSATAV